MNRSTRFGLLLLLAASAGTFLAVSASAQSSTATTSPTMDVATSKRTLTKDEISGDTAEKIAHVCEDFATKHGYPGVIYILDTYGDIVHAHRMDGVRPVQMDGAITKARTALFYRANTHELADRIASDPVQQDPVMVFLGGETGTPAEVNGSNTFALVRTMFASPAFASSAPIFDRRPSGTFVSIHSATLVRSSARPS